MMAYIGGGWYALKSNDPTAYTGVLLFMMAGFISVLGHELGHALTGWKRGGGSVWIRLWALGGLAYHQGGRLDKRNRCAMILAGPGAGLALAAISIVALYVIFPTPEANQRLLYYLSYTMIPHEYMVNIFPDERPIYGFLNAMIWVNVWWSLLNLIPVFPLDGGQFMDQFVKSRKLMHKISLSACLVVMILMMGMQMTMGLFLFGYLAYQNYVGYRDAAY
ncbi:site-2 protease family protein [Verrucomicrobiaceae bacterium 5K15]|uniref:Site-2 protease family protein n=2 Tax=Oceaniferula flava TaxID=2800421 RepID=A0AAE2SDP5_9BACT|nr:site-2 protease family protein [Oceaniferula flavus]MBM1137658.1 site-2 protease family protein [Oceaniferula flavus]